MENWIALSQTAGTGNATITVSASSYSALTSRVTSLTVSGLSASTSVSILQNGVPATPEDCLTFIILTAGTIVWRSNSQNTSIPKTIDYSFDGVSWTSITSSYDNPPSISVSVGDEIRFRGNNTEFASSSPAYYTSFSGSTAYFNVRGNIMSLLDKTDFPTKTSFEPTDNYSRIFWRLFYNTNVVDASELFLPATALTTSCYEEMFENCTSLVSGPVMSATTLASGCCRTMFQNCTSLTTAIVPPATTLDLECYSQMFVGCTSLTTAPSLPATTLAPNCYYRMFRNCGNLVVPPVLPAMELASGCYAEMFRSCSNLIITPALPATGISDSCYSSMFMYCYSLTVAPSLPATTIANGCYGGMFYGCTGLTTAPSILPANVVPEGAYGSMFWSCSALTSAPELPATTVGKNGYYGMFYKCINLTTAPELPATTLGDACYHMMFNGCDNLTSAPSILPATALTENCYRLMFAGCDSLTTAPELPAPRPDYYSYGYMFQNCVSLNYIKCLATDLSITYCTRDWVQNVSPTGTFVKNPNMSGWGTGTSRIPSGWTVIDAT